MQSKPTEKETTTATPPRSARARRRRALLMAGIAVTVVATTVIARYAASRVPDAAPIASPDAVTAAAPFAAPTPAVPLERDAAALTAKPKKTPVVTTARPRAHAAPVAAPAVARASSDEVLPSRTVAADAGASATAVEPTATPDAAGVAPITITGCLETSVDGGEFRLTDTEGIDAPTTRSWRSAFLKKRAAPIALVELSDRKGLQQYVGHRVVATGQLTSRELHVRSLRPAGSSCN